MKESKKLIRRYFRSPKEYKIIMLAAVLLMIASILVFGMGFSNYVAKNRQSDYVCYNGANLVAGDKAYLDITGIDEGIKERDGKVYHAAIDEGIDDDAWYYYMVLIDDTVFNKLDRPVRFYYEETEETEVYRLWGTVIQPSDAFVNEMMEYYDIDIEEYYRTFGSTYLVVDTYNTGLRTFTACMLMLALIAFNFCLTMIIAHSGKVSRLIKYIEKYYSIDEVAQELGNSPVSDEDPVFTDNYLFCRKTVTVARISDIVMTTPIDQGLHHFLAGFLKQGHYQYIDQYGKNGCDHVIEKIQETNPELLINNTPANFDRYQEIVRQYQQEKTNN